MAPRVLRVALTGGIATGKSRCVARFAEWGAPVMSADAVARDLVEPGTDALALIGARFGESVIDGGRLNRAALARVVFADAAARRDLEAILHPRVYAAIATWFTQLDRETPGPACGLGVADVPLLYETRHAADFDRVVVAACRPDQQLDRLRQRDGLSDDDARRRIGSQMPIEEKVRLADWVIDTSGSLADTDRRAREVWDALTMASGAAGATRP